MSPLRLPQAAPSRLVEEGDLISIDIPAHRVHLEVSDDVLAEPQGEAGQCLKPKVKTGYLARYAKPGHLCGQGRRLENSLKIKSLISFSEQEYSLRTVKFCETMSRRRTLRPAAACIFTAHGVK